MSKSKCMNMYIICIYYYLNCDIMECRARDLHSIIYIYSLYNV